jgi:two-component system, NarL family, sensor kinase
MRQNRKFIFILFIVVFLYNHSYTQGLDALLEKLQNVQPDSKERVDLLNQIATKHQRNEGEKALGFALESLNLSQEIKYLEGEAYALNEIGYYYMNKGVYDSSVHYFNQCLLIDTKLNSKEDVASDLNNIAYVQQREGKLKLALKTYFKALKTYEELGLPEQTARLFNNIGFVYDTEAQYELALKYYRKSLKIRKEQNLKRDISESLNNIGHIKQLTGQLDSALWFFHQSISIKKEIDWKRGIGITLNNIGGLYDIQQNIDSALFYYQKSIKIKEEIGDSVNLAQTINNFGDILMRQGNYPKALQYGKRALRLSETAGIPDNIKDAAKLLADIHSILGNYQKAYEYQIQYDLMKDSLFQIETSRQLSEMEAKYESEKKEQAIEMLKKQNEVKQLQLTKEQTLRYSIIVGGLLLLILLFLIYNRNRLKKQKVRLEERQVLLDKINQQQEELLNAIVNTQEAERKRIASELHDGLGSLMSTVKVNLDTVQHQLTNSETQLLSSSIALVDDVCTDLRTISHNMMPGVLVKLGLKAAVNDFVNKVNESNPFNINFECIEFDNRLKDTTEIIIYRVIQEATNNIIKHAEAKNVSIQLMKDEGSISLIIEDDGKGFEKSKIIKGLGLKNIESRINYLGGKTVFETNLGKGCTIVIEIPLKNE